MAAFCVSAPVGARLFEYQTVDGFFGTATTVPDSLAERMRLKKSWRDGCPVSLSDLCYIALSHWGFDGMPRSGELVMHKKLAVSVIEAFADLFALRFPIEKMELMDQYDGDDIRSMEANNASAFNCREITGKQGIWSKHACGMAIDINPVQNPYIIPKDDALTAMGWNKKEGREDFLRRSGYDSASPVEKFCALHPGECLVLPSAGDAFKERRQGIPGMFMPGSKEVAAFTDRGFAWGGGWQRLLDYHHFEFDSADLALSKEMADAG
jgi:hypothetical protein